MDRELALPEAASFPSGMRFESAWKIAVLRSGPNHATDPSKGADMSRWDERDREEAALDEPVTITERQYRSLKRGATLGLCALVLAVLGTGLAVWNFVAGPKNSQANPALAQTAPAESSTTQTATPAPAPAPDSVRSATAPSPAPAAKTATPAATAEKPVVKPVVAAHTSTRHASRSAESAATARAQRSAMGSSAGSQKPQTMQASDLISKPTPAAPSPVTAQPAKPAAKDTTGVH
jgi:cytoskeletal protein RodZ